MERLSVVGKSTPRVDALEKVTGKAKYGVDVELPRMLHAKVLRSRYPHAKILSIDTSKAEKLPGVMAVITAEDTLKERVETTWRGRADKYPVALDKVRYVGEEIAAVAAEDELTAEEALKLIKVEYEELPAIFEPEESMKPGAPKIHNDVEYNIVHKVDVEYGDVEKGFKEADYIFEDRFATAYIHMCQLELTVCIADFDSSGKLTFWENSSDPFMYRRLVAKALGITPSNIRIRQNYIGGNFGHYQTELGHYVITALLAKKAGRPVRLVNTREEEQRLAAQHKEWKLTESLLRLTNNARFMHVMPFDRGNEVDDSVADGPNSIVYDQAENLLHVRKSFLASLMVDSSSLESI